MKRISLLLVLLAFGYASQAQEAYRPSKLEYMRHTVFSDPTWVAVRPLEPAFSHSTFARPGLAQTLEVSNCTLRDTFQFYDDAHRLLGTWHEDPKGAPTRIHLQAYPPGLYTLLRRSKGMVYKLEVERKM